MVHPHRKVLAVVAANLQAWPLDVEQQHSFAPEHAYVELVSRRWRHCPGPSQHSRRAIREPAADGIEKIRSGRRGANERKNLCCSHAGHVEQQAGSMAELPVCESAAHRRVAPGSHLWLYQGSLREPGACAGKQVPERAGHMAVYILDFSDFPRLDTAFPLDGVILVVPSQG